MPRYCQCGCNRKVRRTADRFATGACKAKDAAGRNAADNEAERVRRGLNITNIFRTCGINRFVVDGLDLADPRWPAFE